MEETLQTTSLVKEELTVADVVAQIALIQNLMKAAMKEGEHFGIIPGCKKPSLYKAGAEKLGLIFRLTPEFEISERQDGQHREFRITSRLRHIPSGKIVGEGVGSCSTMESKYRFRGGEKVGTGKSVPKEYWNLKKAGKFDEMKVLIGGEGFGVGKIDGNWEICEIGEKMENDSLADCYNTILKMAKKRAHVDAMLTATAASDIFTQDVEDLPTVAARPEPAQHEEAIIVPDEVDAKESAILSDKISKATRVEGGTKGSLMSIYVDMQTALDNGKISKFSFDTLYKQLGEKKAELKAPKHEVGD